MSSVGIPFIEFPSDHQVNKKPDTINNFDIIGDIALKFHNHPGIKMIERKFRKITKFSLSLVTLTDVKKAIIDGRLDKS